MERRKIGYAKDPKMNSLGKGGDTFEKQQSGVGVKSLSS